MTTHDQNASARAEARWVLLIALYEARHGAVSEGVLAGELAEAGYPAVRGDVQRDLQYLHGRLLVRCEQADHGGWRARILPGGVDLVEYATGAPAGVARPAGGPTVVHRQIREKRWEIVRALAIGMPIETTERTLLRAINDVDDEISEPALRRELCYLQAVGLVEVNDAAPVWRAQLTPDGVDVHEYAADCPAGIDRPARYY